MPHLPKDKERQIYYHVHYFFGSVRVLLSAKKPTLSNTLFSIRASQRSQARKPDFQE